MKRFLAVMSLVLAAVLFGLERPTWGLVAALEIEDLTAAAEVILLGRVEGVRAFWTEDKAMILTEAVISVEKVLKGAVAKEVRVLVGGGRIPEEDIGLWIPDEARFEPGEIALLFLKRLSEEHYGVAGGFQGKFAISSDQEGQWLAGNASWPPRPLYSLLSHLEGLIGR